MTDLEKIKAAIGSLPEIPTLPKFRYIADVCGVLNNEYGWDMERVKEKLVLQHMAQGVELGAINSPKDLEVLKLIRGAIPATSINYHVVKSL